MTDYLSEHDEFLLSQLLDGDLPADEELALRERLNHEPALRRGLDGLTRVDECVRSQHSPMPAIDIESFHARLMGCIASTTVGSMTIGSTTIGSTTIGSTTIESPEPVQPELNEQDEFLLSRLLDDGLSVEDTSLVSERLRREPALQARFESLQALDAALQARRTPMPPVDYDRFHKQVMRDVRKQAQPTRRTSNPRILRFPMWARFAAPLAAAAAIMMAVWLQPGALLDNKNAPLDPSNGPIARVEPLPSEPVSSERVPSGAVPSRTVPPGRVPSESAIEPRALARAADPGSAPEAGAPIVTLVRTNAPLSSGTGTIEIQVGKPGNASPQTDTIQVSFARSTRLADAVQAGDRERSNQPSRKSFFAAASPAPRTIQGQSTDLF